MTMSQAEVSKINEVTQTFVTGPRWPPSDR